MISMIEELREHDSVESVEQAEYDPAYWMVAVDSQESFRDTWMKQPSGTFRFPQEVIDQVQMDLAWQIDKLEFRVSGDYAGCFTLRLVRDPSKIQAAQGDL